MKKNSKKKKVDQKQYNQRLFIVVGFAVLLVLIFQGLKIYQASDFYLNRQLSQTLESVSTPAGSATLHMQIRDLGCATGQMKWTTYETCEYEGEKAYSIATGEDAAKGSGRGVKELERISKTLYENGWTQEYERDISCVLSVYDRSAGSAQAMISECSSQEIREEIARLSKVNCDAATWAERGCERVFIRSGEWIHIRIVPKTIRLPLSVLNYTNNRQSSVIHQHLVENLIKDMQVGRSLVVLTTFTTYK